MSNGEASSDSRPRSGAVMQVVLVGCGRMGGALLRGWISAGITPLHVIDPGVGETPGAQMLAGYEAVAGLGGPVCIVLAVKPALVASALHGLAPYLTPDSLVISIAAGVRLAQLRSGVGEGPSVVRTIPNTPAAIGRGVVAAISDAELDASRRNMAQSLLDAAGEVVWLDDEALIDAVTAVSGSGPAYFYRFTELLAEAGRDLGLPAPMADRLAELTFTGAAAWLEASGRDPASLRVEVTSPNGVTAAALAVFDARDQLGELIGAAAQAAVARSREMGEGG